MASMNIKDPEVRELAIELARRRHTTATGAVREALREALERDKTSRQGLAERLLAIGRESAAIDEPFLTDNDLYDENGAPR